MKFEMGQQYFSIIC